MLLPERPGVVSFPDPALLVLAQRPDNDLGQFQRPARPLGLGVAVRAPTATPTRSTARQLRLDQLGYLLCAEAGALSFTRESVEELLAEAETLAPAPDFVPGLQPGSSALRCLRPGRGWLRQDIRGMKGSGETARSVSVLSLVRCSPARE
jgi:hypothetical protein